MSYGNSIPNSKVEQDSRNVQAYTSEDMSSNSDHNNREVVQHQYNQSIEQAPKSLRTYGDTEIASQRQLQPKLYGDGAYNRAPPRYARPRFSHPNQHHSRFSSPHSQPPPPPPPPPPPRSQRLPPHQRFYRGPPPRRPERSNRPSHYDRPIYGVRGYSSHRPPPSSDYSRRVPQYHPSFNSRPVPDMNPYYQNRPTNSYPSSMSQQHHKSENHLYSNDDTGLSVYEVTEEGEPTETVILTHQRVDQGQSSTKLERLSNNGDGQSSHLSINSPNGSDRNTDANVDHTINSQYWASHPGRYHDYDFPSPDYHDYHDYQYANSNIDEQHHGYDDEPSEDQTVTYERKHIHGRQIKQITYHGEPRDAEEDATTGTSSKDLDTEQETHTEESNGVKALAESGDCWDDTSMQKDSKDTQAPSEDLKHEEIITGSDVDDNNQAEDHVALDRNRVYLEESMKEVQALNQSIWDKDKITCYIEDKARKLEAEFEKVYEKAQTEAIEVKRKVIMEDFQKKKQLRNLVSTAHNINNNEFTKIQLFAAIDGRYAPRDEIAERNASLLAFDEMHNKKDASSYGFFENALLFIRARNFAANHNHENGPATLERLKRKFRDDEQKIDKETISKRSKIKKDIEEKQKKSRIEEKSRKEALVARQEARESVQVEQLKKEMLEKEKAMLEKQIFYGELIAEGKRKKEEKEMITEGRLEKEKFEKERTDEIIETERDQKEAMAQIQKFKKEEFEKGEQERSKEVLEKEKVEEEQLDKEELEQERIWKTKLEKNKLNQSFEKLAKELTGKQFQKANDEKEKAEREKLQNEKVKKEAIEKIERERILKQSREKVALEQEKLRKQKEEKEREMAEAQKRHDTLVRRKVEKGVTELNFKETQPDKAKTKLELAKGGKPFIASSTQVKREDTQIQKGLSYKERPVPVRKISIDFKGQSKILRKQDTTQQSSLNRKLTTVASVQDTRPALNKRPTSIAPFPTAKKSTSISLLPDMTPKTNKNSPTATLLPDFTSTISHNAHREEPSADQNKSNIKSSNETLDTKETTPQNASSASKADIDRSSNGIEQNKKDEPLDLNNGRVLPGMATRNNSSKNNESSLAGSRVSPEYLSEKEEQLRKKLKTAMVKPVSKVDAQKDNEAVSLTTINPEQSKRSVLNGEIVELDQEIGNLQNSVTKERALAAKNKANAETTNDGEPKYSPKMNHAVAKIDVSAKSSAIPVNDEEPAPSQVFLNGAKNAAVEKPQITKSIDTLVKRLEITGVTEVKPKPKVSTVKDETEKNNGKALLEQELARITNAGIPQHVSSNSSEEGNEEKLGSDTRLEPFVEHLESRNSAIAEQKGRQYPKRLKTLYGYAGTGISNQGANYQGSNYHGPSQAGDYHSQSLSWKPMHDKHTPGPKPHYSANFYPQYRQYESYIPPSKKKKYIPIDNQESNPTLNSQVEKHSSKEIYFPSTDRTVVTPVTSPTTELPPQHKSQQQLPLPQTQQSQQSQGQSQPQPLQRFFSDKRPTLTQKPLSKSNFKKIITSNNSSNTNDSNKRKVSVSWNEEVKFVKFDESDRIVAKGKSKIKDASPHKHAIKDIENPAEIRSAIQRAQVENEGSSEKRLNNERA